MPAPAPFGLGCCDMRMDGGLSWLGPTTTTELVSCWRRWWPEGRLTVYQADSKALAYPYSGKIIEAQPWHPAVLEIKVLLRCFNVSMEKSVQVVRLACSGALREVAVCLLRSAKAQLQFRHKHSMPICQQILLLLQPWHCNKVCLSCALLVPCQQEVVHCLRSRPCAGQA